MNSKYWIISYLAVLAVDVYAVYSGNETIRYASKTLLIPILVVYFLLTTKSLISSLIKWIILALLFSWAGDILLMFESSNDNFFMFGLIAFLFAHVFYILFFASVSRKEIIPAKWLVGILCLTYYLILMRILDPYLGKMEWPVRIYGVVIMAMLYSACHMLFIPNKNSGYRLIAGALLFVISDSLLALNKFYNQFEYAGIAVMLTYGIAQLLLTIGSAKYITSISKQ